MERLDAVIIATDLFKEVPGAGIRDQIRLSVQGHPATMAFLLQYFQAGRDAEKASEVLRKDRQQRVPLPLNGPYLHHYLSGHGLNTKVIPFFSLQKEQLKHLLFDRPRTVVISTTFFPFAPQIEAVAAYVREHAPDAVLIAGGIQIWKSYKTKKLLETGQITPDIREFVCRDHYLLDPDRPSLLEILVVSDRGEHTLARLLKRIRKGQDVRDMENIAFFEQQKWNLNPIEKEPNDFMDQSLDWGAFPSEFTKEEIPVHAGTGCPFRCAFCDFCSLRPMQRRPVESLIREIRSIPPVNGIRQVFFTDDNLFFSIAQLKQFCQTVQKEELSLQWRSFLRVDTVTEETAELLKLSGCRECLLGVESGDAGVLARMNKRTSPEAVLQAVTHLNRVGINTQSTFLVGFPGETERSVQATIDLLNAYPTDGPGIHVHYPFFMLVAPLARVASAESRARYGLKGYLDQWSHDTMTSEEAKEAVQRICDSVKPELSPIYHGERVVYWLSQEQQKRVILLRNKLNRLRRGILPEEPEEPLWGALEEIFSSVRCH